MNREELDNLQKEIGGWCSPEKRESLVNLIKDTKPSRIVEIGVFSGSSFFPMALQLQENQWGHIYGIDPWNTEACLEDMRNKENIEYWNNQNMLLEVFTKVMEIRSRLNLDSYCTVIKERSEDVHKTFEDKSIDILHIDGSHSAIPAMRDGQLYYPKVKTGGYIYIDDIGWTEGGELTVRPMADWLIKQGCEEVGEVTGCCILKKRGTE